MDKFHIHAPKSNEKPFRKIVITISGTLNCNGMGLLHNVGQLYNSFKKNYRKKWVCFCTCKNVKILLQKINSVVIVIVKLNSVVIVIFRVIHH